MITLRSVLLGVVLMLTFLWSLTSYAGDSKKLILAINQGDLAEVETLLGNGADVNAYNNNGVTPLHFASLKGNLEIVKLLLNANADVNKVHKANGDTPLNMASSYGHTEIVKVLLGCKSGCE